MASILSPLPVNYEASSHQSKDSPAYVTFAVLPMSVSMTRIGLYIDGAHFTNASTFYSYNHVRGARLSLTGLRNFVLQRISEEEGVPAKLCRVVEAHYFSGRSNLAESRDRESDVLARERWWDGILMKSDITAHYLPYGPRGEKGIDVLLSLECFEAATLKGLDVVVLVTGDSDFLPLVRKLNSRGVRVMVFGFTYQFQNQQGRERGSGTSRALLNEANYPVAVDELIDNYDELSEAQRKLVDDLFVRKRTVDDDNAEGNGGAEADDAPAPGVTASRGESIVEPQSEPAAIPAESAPVEDRVPATAPSQPEEVPHAADGATESVDVGQQEPGGSGQGSPRRSTGYPRRSTGYPRRMPASRESLERLARNGINSVVRTVDVVRPANFVTGVSEISRERVPGHVTRVLQGYGFIKSEWGKESLFFHHSDVENDGFDQIQEGTRVTFIEMKGERGMVAKNIQVPAATENEA